MLIVAGAPCVGVWLGLAAADAIARPARAAADPGELRIISPLNGATIPADMAALSFRWHDPAAWPAFTIEVTAEGREGSIRAVVNEAEWRPSSEQWARLREIAGQSTVLVSVGRHRPQSHEPANSAATVRFRFSADPVDAPVFYREVSLPLHTAVARLPQIRWRLGWVSARDEPPTVLTGLATCANCHTFSAHGSVLAMDVDYGADKGSFAITEVAPETVIEVDRLVSWNDALDEAGQHSLGLFSRVSPDGRYVASTVGETTVHRGLPDPDRPQIFFPVRGVIAIYDRERGEFSTLPGADRPDMVQTNPVWSPDQRWLVFARAPAIPLEELEPGPPVRVPRQVIEEFVSGRRSFRFDLYRVPFNGGRGGEPEAISGAAQNGRSNFFPTFSPDGRWIVFCQAPSFMLNQLDSELHIMPSRGGETRRLDCNFDGRMNSWHSFSPNGRWLVFASKADGPYSQMWLTHMDEEGHDSVPVRLDGFVAPQRAANLPEFVPLKPGDLEAIRISGELR